MSFARENSQGEKPAKSAEVAEAGEQSQPQNPFPIVGIGASAGGLEALTQLLSSLPENTGMAFVLVQHLDPDHQSHLTNLLAKATTMPVREVKNGMAIKPNNVFVIPPNVNMGIANGKLKLTPRDEKYFPHLPVDFLFRSLAKEQQSWAIGVILSGTGSDGAMGLAEIKGAGGLTFAQDEKSAKFSGMPLHAGGVDFVLPPEKIAQELGRIGHDPYLVLPPKAHEKLSDYVNAIVDTVRGPFLVLRDDLRVHKANDAFFEAFQVSAKETENHSIYELGNGQWDIPQLRQPLSEILAGKSALKDFEIEHRFPKIGRRVMLLNARRLEQKTGAPPMILLSIEDITEFKQIEEVNQWLAAIVESSGDAIIGKDLNGVIISCNQGASRLFGYKPEEIIGKPVTILIPPELQNEEIKILERIRRGERIEHFETVRRHKDGSLVDVSLTISPVKDSQGKIIGASKIARDITERRRTEKNLAESLAREKIARATAESASRAKDDFLAALSHELRTPLNPVLLIASDAAKNRDLAPGVRTDFESIRKNIEMEARLIDDLLDLTRITFGKLCLDVRIVDAHPILQDAIATSKSELDQKQIKLSLKLNAKQHAVRADAVRLQQVFWNVLKNAVKFTPAGGKVTVETFTSAGNKKWGVKITDTGLGMTREELERIFSAFSQGDHHESRRFGGLGLGLAISRKLMEFHSGEIRAASDGRNRGSTFIIELPLMLPEEENSFAAGNSPANFPQKKTKTGRVRILLVEDHEPTRDALTRLLIRRRYKVRPAASLAEARRFAEKEKFDLVISDIGLPDGSGNELMSELRKHYGLKGIALTGYGMEQDIAQSLAAGFVAHLTKPVHVQSLENALAFPALIHQ